MELTPNYYTHISSDIRYDCDLSPNEKLLYSEIETLSAKEGFCWATNSYFAKLYKVTSHTVSRWVSRLSKLGYINTKIDNTNHRKIYIDQPLKQQKAKKDKKKLDKANNSAYTGLKLINKGGLTC